MSGAKKRSPPVEDSIYNLFSTLIKFFNRQLYILAMIIFVSEYGGKRGAVLAYLFYFGIVINGIMNLHGILVKNRKKKRRSFEPKLGIIGSKAVINTDSFPSSYNTKMQAFVIPRFHYCCIKVEYCHLQKKEVEYCCERGILLQMSTITRWHFLQNHPFIRSEAYITKNKPFGGIGISCLRYGFSQ